MDKEWIFSFWNFLTFRSISKWTDSYIEKNEIELIMKLKLYKWIFLNKKGLYTQQKSDIHNKLIRKKRMSWRIITHPRKMKALTDLLVTLPLSSMFFSLRFVKGRFFSESIMHFSHCPKNVPKTILEKRFWNCLLFRISWL